MREKVERSEREAEIKKARAILSDLNVMTRPRWCGASSSSSSKQRTVSPKFEKEDPTKLGRSKKSKTSSSLLL